jgi:hypothetical protein
VAICTAIDLIVLIAVSTQKSLNVMDATDQNDIHVKMTQFDAFPGRLFTSNRITGRIFKK